MNIILLETGEVKDQKAVLADDRARHIVKVLRSIPGDTVKVGMVNGKIGSGTIKQLSSTPPYRVVIAVRLEQEPPPTPPLDILLALPRPIMLRRILSQVATLGIGHLYVVNANRVEKSFWNGSITNADSCRNYFLDGLAQAVDTRLPGISFHRGFKPFMEDFARLAPGYKLLLLAHPNCRDTLAEVFRPGCGRILLAIGPEGGWVDYEMDRMREAGFSMFSIGSRILKVETAVTALHSMVSLLNSQSFRRY